MNFKVEFTGIEEKIITILKEFNSKNSFPLFSIGKQNNRFVGILNYEIQLYELNTLVMPEKYNIKFGINKKDELIMTINNLYSLTLIYSFDLKQNDFIYLI